MTEVTKMKKIISITCIAALLLATLCLSACGGTGLDGVYKLISIESGGNDLSSVLQSVDVYMTIEKDQATLNFADQTMKWTIDSKAGIMRNEDGAESPYHVEDGKIILESNEEGSSNKMIFEKAAATADSK